MKKLISILLLLVAFVQLNAQLATIHSYVSSNYKDVLYKNGVQISIKVIPGKKSSDGATIYWQIKNNTNVPIFLEGNFQVTGKPSTATSSYGDALGKSKGGGSIPGDRVNANSTGEFQRPAEWVNDVDAITITLYAIHKGDQIKSGNGN